MPPVTVNDAVGERLSRTGPEVRERVIAQLTDNEVARRANLVIQGISLLDKLQSQLRRMKPDQKSLSAQGVVLNESWSPKAYEERVKLQKRADAFEHGINTALEQNDYAPLEKAVKDDKPDKPAGAPEGGSSTPSG